MSIVKNIVAGVVACAAISAISRILGVVFVGAYISEGSTIKIEPPCADSVPTDTVNDKKP